MTTYHSTRDAGNTLTASQAILKGIAPDGGLYVPDHIPSLDIALDQLANLSYQETAYAVMKNFFDDFTEEELKHCIAAAYDEKFDDATIAPLVKADGHYYLELFHGPTIAFKDMALSILPHLLTTSAKKNGSTKEIVILTATSGDTGKAALVGFADVPNTKIIIFYPKNGVSAIQEKQMVTQKGDNTLCRCHRRKLRRCTDKREEHVRERRFGGTSGCFRLSVLIRQLDQHRTFDSASRLLRVRLRPNGQTRRHRCRRTHERGCADR